MLPRHLKLKRADLNLARACHVMHAGLVTIFVVLVVIASQRYEHNINYPFTTAGQKTMSATVTVVTQTFSIVCPQV